MKVNEPTTEETPVSTTSKWVVATEVAGGMEVLITGVKSDVTYAISEQASSNRTTVAGTLDEGVFTPGENTMSFTLVAQDGGKYALRTSNGKYLYAASSSANQLKTRDAIGDDGKAVWTISINGDNEASIVANCETANWRNVMQFNQNGSNNPVVACYASANQSPIKLYVPQSVTPEPPTPAYTDIRTGLTAGNYYTVCWPKAMTAIKGGTLWSFAGKDASMAYLIQEDAPFVAGRPYIIYATADKLEAIVDGDDALSAGENNGLYGTLDYMDAVALEAAGATYMLKNNELRPIGTNNHLDANRAYVILENIQGEKPLNVPAHKVRAIPTQGTEAQGVDNLNASETPVKMMIDGQLFIIRGEHMFDATGRLVK